MTSCDDILDLISRWLDGDLTDGEQALLNEHLAQCPQCRSLAQELKRCHEELSALGETQPPEGFADRVMARVKAETAVPKVIPFFRRPYGKGLSALAACAVLCVGLYGAGLFGPADKSIFSGGAPRAAEAAPAQAPVPAPSASAPASSAEDSVTLFSTPSDAPDTAGTPEASLSPAYDSANSGGGDGSNSLSGFGGTAPALGQSAKETSESFQNDQYLRVCYGFTPAAPAAQILGSAASLSDFLARFPADDLSAVTAAYGADYFQSGRLLAVVLEENSGSVSHRLDALSANEVTVSRQIPETGACDMAAWLILAEVDDSFADGAVLTVRLEPEP